MSQTAKQLFDDNVRYNAKLAKRRQKKKMKWPVRLKLDSKRKLKKRLEEIGMEKQEVIAKLHEWGLKVSPHNTLRNWEKWGLIPEAIYRDSRKTIYPESTAAEAYASKMLMDGKHTIKKELLRDIRALALKTEGQKITGQPHFSQKREKEPWTWDDFAQGKHEPEIPGFIAEWVQLMDEPEGWAKAGFVVNWIQLKHSKLQPDCKCDICTSNPFRILIKVSRMAGIDVIVGSQDIEKMQEEDELNS